MVVAILLVFVFYAFYAGAWWSDRHRPQPTSDHQPDTLDYLVKFAVDQLKKLEEGFQAQARELAELKRPPPVPQAITGTAVSATSGSTATAVAPSPTIKVARNTLAGISEAVDSLRIAAKGAVERYNAALWVIKDINSSLSDQELTPEQKVTKARERIVTYYAKAKASNAPDTAAPTPPESAS